MIPSILTLWHRGFRGGVLLGLAVLSTVPGLRAVGGTGNGVVIGSDIREANGKIYDYVVLTGPAVTVVPDAGQVARVIFADPDDDLVFVDYSGAGSMNITLDNPTGPAALAKYDLSGGYMKGRARITIQGHNATSNLTVAAVGSMTSSVNASVFKSNVTYDGVADIGSIQIVAVGASQFDGLHAGNARFSAATGVAGISASNVTFNGPVMVGDIDATSDAAALPSPTNGVPSLLLGAATDVRILGGDLAQSNGANVRVSGFTELKFGATTNAHGVNLPAKSNLGVLQNVAIPGQPVFTGGTIGSVFVDASLSFTVKASAVSAPTYSIAAGNLPTWATLNATTGLISGTPAHTAGSPFVFTVRATNGSASATQTITISVLAPDTARNFVLAITGDPAPDGIGTLAIPYRFALSEGAAAFASSTFEGRGGVPADRILATATRSGYRTVFREGANAPNNGQFVGVSDQITVNPSGRVAFGAALSNTPLWVSPGVGLDIEGVFSGADSSSITQIVRENQPEPAGPGVFGSFGPVYINSSNQVAFWGSIRDAGPQQFTNGIFVGDGGALTQIVRTQTAAPGGGTFTGVAGPTGFSETGEVAFLGETTSGYGIFRGNGTTLVAIARANQVPPEGNGRLEMPDGLCQNSDNKVAVYTSLKETSGGTTEWGIYRGTGGPLTKIVRTGEAAPGSGQFDYLNNTLSINGRGDVAFTATRRNFTGHPELVTDGLYESVYWGDGTQIKAIARTGDPAPEGGSVFTGFTLAAINDSRTVAFQAGLSFGPNYRGIYLGDGTETMLVARVGDQVLGSTIVSLGFDPKAYNAFKEIAYQVGLANGRWGVLLFSPKLKWRQNGDGTWDDGTNWTVSLRPAGYAITEIDPATGGLVTGPEVETTLRSLKIGGTTTGTAELNLKATGPVTVVEGATVGAHGKVSGVGVIKGNVANAGTVSPGNSPGLLKIDGNFAQSATGQSIFQIGGTDPALSDQLWVTGTADVAGTVKIELINGFVPTVPVTVAVIRAQSLHLSSPTFQAPAGYRFTTAIKNVDDGQILQVTLTPPGPPLALTAVQSIASKNLTVATASFGFVPVTGSGGTEPYTYAVSPALPAGLTFDASTGAISGMATAESSATYTITVTDAATTTAPNTFVLTVMTAPEITVANPRGEALGSSHGLFDDQFLGTRFFVPTSLNVTSITAIVSSGNNQNLFAAIVRLPNSSAFPTAATGTGLNIPGEVVFSTLFNPGTTSGVARPITIPASVTLDAGTYAVVFGGGLFGSPSSASGGLQNYNLVTGGDTIGWTAPSLTWSGPQFDVLAHGTPTYGISLTGTVAADVTPVITTQPVNQTVNVGQTATFTVGAFVAPSATYQWRKNGVAIAGATSAALMLSNVRSGDAGSYDVVVSNQAGGVISNSVTLTVKTGDELFNVLGAPVASSSAIFVDQFVGARIAIDSTGWIMSATGKFSLASGTYFVAVVPLASVAALPVGTPASGIPFNAGEVLTHVEFSMPSPFYSGDLTVPVGIHVPPGVYGIVFGTGLYGTSGSGNMPGYATTAASTGFIWSSEPYRWQNGSLRQNRIGVSVQYGASGEAPVITTQPVNQAVPVGDSATFSVVASGTPTPTFKWQFNGVDLPDGTGATLTIANVQPANAGIYRALATNLAGSALSVPAILGVSTTSKVVGGGVELQPVNILAPAGYTFDQVLLTGAAATVTADPGQVTRISYIDLTDDIVQLEFSGAGSLTIALDNATGPAAPVNYNQAVSYMKGHARIVIVGANQSTNVSVATVGRATTFDPTGAFNFLLPVSATNNPANNGSALFIGRASTVYDGVADLASIAITSANGQFGGVRTSNASFSASNGLTGLYAPGVQFTGPVFVNDINASAAATPVLVIGSSTDTRITGGDLLQANGQPMQVAGLTQLKFTAGITSQGIALPAQTNHANLQQNGTDVTAQIVVNPVGPPTVTQSIASKILTAGAAAAAFTPVTASGGTTPYSFSVAPTLPSGLTLNTATGAISGTPAAALEATAFTVTVTDAAVAIASNTFSLTVNPALTTTQAVASKSLTVGTAAVAFTPVTVAGGTGPYVFAVSPALPAGLVLNSGSGEVSGTPTAVSSATIHTITVTDSVGATSSKTFSLAVRGVAPAISAPPQSQAVSSGVSFTLNVGGSGTPPFTYQWRKDGTEIAGATSASYTVTSATNSGTGSAGFGTTGDAGAYTVFISNSGGDAISEAATITVIPAGFGATHAVVERGYVGGSGLTITNTITYPGAVSSLAWQVLLPEGWSFVADGGTVGDSRPAAGHTDFLEWIWHTPPVSPVTFTYTVNAPASATAPQEFAALMLPELAGVQSTMLVKPDPLMIFDVSRHSADTDRDSRITLTELLRVIELYNTRNGTVRTGAYAVDPTNLEDGFATDPTRTGATVVTLNRYHSADTGNGVTPGSPPDGKMELTELLRVIELYNHRTGTVRDGLYHVEAGTEDGFADGAAAAILRANAGTTSEVLTGGAGDDILIANQGRDTLIGGGGSNTFVIALPGANMVTYSTIIDAKVGDKLQLKDKGTETFIAFKIVMPPSAVFVDYANAVVGMAGDASLNGVVGWFQFNDDTYVVESLSNNASSAGFVNGTDIVVRLAGLINLSNSTLQQDSSGAPEIVIR